MGIDHGLKRIGLAVSDPTGLIATELTVIQRASRREDFERINTLADSEDVVAFVVGIPHNTLDEDVYSQEDTVRLWISRFQETTSLPVIEWDEQLTSEDAHELARSKGRSWREPVDDLAARLILQSYLDALKDGLATFPLHRDDKPFHTNSGRNEA